MVSHHISTPEGIKPETTDSETQTNSQITTITTSTQTKPSVSSSISTQTDSSNHDKGVSIASSPDPPNDQGPSRCGFSLLHHRMEENPRCCRKILTVNCTVYKFNKKKTFPYEGHNILDKITKIYDGPIELNWKRNEIRSVNSDVYRHEVQVSMGLKKKTIGWVMGDAESYPECEQRRRTFEDENAVQYALMHPRMKPAYQYHTFYNGEKVLVYRYQQEEKCTIMHNEFEYDFKGECLDHCPSLDLYMLQFKNSDDATVFENNFNTHSEHLKRRLKELEHLWSRSIPIQTIKSEQLIFDLK